MSHLEPTYLRIIHDGLLNGSIHKDNAADLPDGLIGLYEEAFDDGKSAVERQMLLQRFVVWALLKKEVSAAFVAEILGETENEIQAFISNNSAWFNSPESGKYQLYHERLKVFFLQKMNELELGALHGKIVARLEWSFEAKKADEFELYSLEFLSIYLGVEAMISGNGSILLKFAYSQTNWQRQLKISKGYKWTKNSLNAVMTWASKYNQNEVIECGLQLVDLNFQMQNSASEIVTMVKEGHTESAINRIENFGGSDSEGEKRKFILNMLCIMELTLLDSIDKSHRKSSIAELLKHLDEQLSTDQTVLNWCKFFPSNLVFKMAFECANLGLDYLFLFKRIDDLKLDWVAEQGPYNELQFEVLAACARGIKDDFFKCQAIVAISTEMFKQEMFEGAFSAMQEAISYAQGISDNSWKSSAFIDISTGLAKQGLFEEALSFAQSIGEEWESCSALVALSLEFFTLGKIDESLSSIEEAISYVHRFEKHDDNNDWDEGRMKSEVLFSIWIGLFKLGKIEEAKSFARSFLDGKEIDDSNLITISTEYSIQGKFDKALTNARSINEDYKKSQAFVAISSQLYKQSKFEEASFVMQEALSLSQGRTKRTGNGMGDLLVHAITLKAICTELAKQGKFEEALTHAQNNSKALGAKRDLTLAAIYSEMIKKDKLEELSFTLHASLSCTRGLSEYRQNHLLAEVSRELVKQGKIENAITYMPKNYSKFIELSIGLMKQGKTKEASIALQEAIPYARAIDLNISKINALVEISTEQFKQGQLEFASSSLNEALSCIHDINSDWANSKEGISRSLIAQEEALFTISTEMAKQGKFDEALTIARSLNNEDEKSRALAGISTEFYKQGKLDEALTIARSINNEHEKSRALAMISTEFYKQGKLEESSSAIVDAFSSAMGIHVAKYKNDLRSSDIYKCSALVAISSELFKQSKLIESSKVINETISFALNISDHYDKEITLEHISRELVNQGDFDQAFTIARSLNNDYNGNRALQDIFIEMTSQGNFDKALTIARSLNNDYEKSRALAGISTEFYKQSKFEEASSAINEAIYFAVNISDEDQKTVVFAAISCALALLDKFEEAEKIGLKIPQTAVRQGCWKTHAENAIKNNSWRLALLGMQRYKSDESQLFYIKGWSTNVAIKDVSAICISKVLPLFVNDIGSIELNLQKFALHEIMLDLTLPELQQRLNRTLNIQWAIDIKNQFVN